MGAWREPASHDGPGAAVRVNRDTLARAIAVLEAEGLLWAVPRKGTVVRHDMSRSRRPRGNLVTGPAGEPPFQTNDSYIHPRGLADAPEVAAAAAAPGDWLYWLEAAGH